LAAALTGCLALPAVQTAQAAPARPATPPTATTAAPHTPPNPTDPHDHVDRLAKPATPSSRTPVPGGGRISPGHIPGDLADGKPDTGRPVPRALGGAVPCTLDGITGLTPERLADFLTDPAVTAGGCLHGLIWTWDPRLVPVLSPAHVQAVARRAAALAPAHGGTDATHLLELFTYLHAAVYHDFSHTEIDLTDPATIDAMRRAIAAFGTAAHTFDPTRQNAETLREALIAGSSTGLRQYQTALIARVLGTLAPGTGTAADPSWGDAVFGALTVNYLGIYPGNNDTAFRAAVAADSGYRAAFRAYSGYTHLKNTANAWAVRDALSEYGRFGQIDSLKPAVLADLGTLLRTATANFGDLSAPWASVASWLIFFQDCDRYQVCVPQIEARVFPRTYTYDKGGIQVRTALDAATVDQLYYASKQVKTQFFDVLGTDRPLTGDPNATLHIHLYASRADYEVLHPLLTGMGTQNGGVYIEDGATFYTYQRRVPQDSSLTLEELFRHEYTHYLNGRWAVPGMFGDPRWFANDLTTAMDEGTAEFFAGSTRQDGVEVRKSLVKGVIADTAGGGPRMSVDRLLHATYDGDGFRFYNYAGTFFEFLWTHHPSLLREMYGYERADDPKGFDAWRTRLGANAALQHEYDAFLDEQIAKVDGLFVPDTHYVPVGSLRLARPDAVTSALASATGLTPVCTGNGDTNGKPRFTCTGRVTARLADSHDPDEVFADMVETVDYFVLDRAEPAANNFADMNCSFGPVDIWSDGTAGTSTYTCEGPLHP
ncbi:collagenase, partial [Streptomyces sp. NPDC049577]|uniref:collagenase n=1 Tax=Streptomyces sp. NPDC049577 TaxID=3155153 RepID=UPI003421124F